LAEVYEVLSREVIADHSLLKAKDAETSDACCSRVKNFTHDFERRRDEKDKNPTQCSICKNRAASSFAY